MAHTIPATPGANNLLDQLLADNQLKNDAALARELGVAPPVVSKLRHGRLTFGPTLILTVHEKFGVAVKSIRETLAGDAA
jgi:plasmid maintenance system antidote protein VapI